MKLWPIEGFYAISVCMSPVLHGLGIGRRGSTGKHKIKVVQCDDGHAVVTNDGCHSATGKVLP
jgi:hypothetical protein